MSRYFCNKNLERYYQREEKSFIQQKQNLVSLAHDVTQYW